MNVGTGRPQWIQWMVLESATGMEWMKDAGSGVDAANKQMHVRGWMRLLLAFGHWRPQRRCWIQGHGGQRCLMPEENGHFQGKQLSVLAEAGTQN